MHYDLKPIQEAEIKGKKVIMRVDYDVVKDGAIKDDDRLIKSLPTIQHILDHCPKQLILIAHNGKPQDNDQSLSLKPVQEWLEQRLGQEVGFVDDCLQITLPETPQVLLLENLRYYPGEKNNDENFAKHLAGYADIYVGNAFATAHRAHASMVGIPRYLPSYAGLILQQEVEMLSKVTDTPEHPFATIVGFAKISDKIEVLETLLNKSDKLLLGGAVVFTFLKAQGYEIGKSLCEDDKLELAQRLLNTYKEKLILPTDFTIADSIEGDNPRTATKEQIPKDAIGLDIGPESTALFSQELQDARTIFWNGPVGMFEKKPFDSSTNDLARYLADTDKTVIIGGGDTTKAMKNAGVYGRMTHISTGGGASLQFIEGKELPGLKVLCR
ncbi:MAG: phosphoglycerate kinase [Nanoarchaeota archaeon]